MSAHRVQNLVEVLQQCFDLFGARESCAQGLCGCCTVLVDGTAVSGCLFLAAFALSACTFVAAVIPARRAASISPTSALRAE